MRQTWEYNGVRHHHTHTGNGMNTWQSTSDILTKQTHDYWKLSSTIMGRLQGKVTVQKAIDRINELEEGLGPHRSLRRSVRSLSDIVVQGKRFKKNTPATITLLTRSEGNSHVA